MPRPNKPSRTLLFSVTLADCDVQTLKGTGPGGQNKNKRETDVRITHRESGAVGYSGEQRSQLQNKKAAFRRMTETKEFKIWLAREQWISSGMPSPEETVEKEMAPENIRVEVKQDGKWTLEGK